MKKLTKKKTTNLPVSKKREWLLLGVILFVTFLVYLPALQNNFTNWDDDLYVTNNDAITSISVGNINKFNENFVGNFHPLTMISLALDYHFFKLNPFYYHLKNILFHLLNTLLVFLFVKKISRNNLKAIQLDPKNYRAYSNRGKIFYDRGKIDLALKDFNKSLAINPDFANALANRGAARGMKKEWQKALTDLNRAIELEPSNTNALKNRGLVFYNLKKFKKNIDDYRNYLRYEPGNADIISIIALCYQQLKKYDKALTEFNRAIAINPNEGAYYYN
ncbi:MAG: tetratricopeptide repeat protein, partial [Prolixibacteraceae bacterium]|nr:tetratricopeptide repeat protein [Prolixibacteraceae bacterium]